MEFNQAVELLCISSIEPVFVCSNEEFLNCNDQFAEAIRANKEDLLVMDLPSIIQSYFLPSYHANGSKEVPHISALSFIQTRFNSKKMNIPVKVSSWNFEKQIYFTITIHEISKTIYTSYINCDFQENSSNLSLKSDIKTKSFEELKQIADAMPCIVFCTDPQGQQMKTLNLGSTEDWWSCLPKEESSRKMEILSKCLVKGEEFEDECRLKPLSKGKEEKIYKWYLVKIVPVYLKDNKTIDKWIGTAYDINDMKIALEEKQKLEISEKQAQESSRIKSEFVAIMSHELRTPLFGVIGSVSLLSKQFTDPSQNALLETIQTSANFLSTLIQDILDYSRIETGKLTMVSESFALSKLLNSVTSITKSSAEAKGLDFKIDLRAEDCELCGDFNRTLQIFNNLISNSIKFTKTGSVSITVGYTKKPRNATMLNVRIEDTGCGISKKSLKNIFCAWSQTEQGAKISMSSGLGLYISKSLVDMMHGEIGIDNIETGTRAWFNIPFKLKNNEFTASNKTHQKNKRSSYEKELADGFWKNKRRKNHKVMLAEDNPINQKIMGKYLEKLEILYDLASDGQEALNKYLKNEKGYYTLILMDQSMPKYNGDYVCQKIKERDQTQLIISVSANVFIKDVHNFNLSSNLVDDYIFKPFTFETFREKIKKWFT